MAIAYADRVQETTATTGTGTVTLAGAVSGFQSFTTAFGANETVFYCITSGTAWEVGQGVFTNSGTTLTRATILASSSGGSAITLAGTSNVFNVRPAVVATGSYVGTTLLTSASSTFTTGANTVKIKIRGVAGGGGGGGTAATAYRSSGGGGAGSYAEKTFAVSPSTAYTYTCGAGGGGNSGSGGSNGASSTFIVGATTVTCNGGTGAAVGTNQYGPQGAGGVVSTNGDVNIQGQDGFIGIQAGGNPQYGGSGGSSQFGAGGPPSYQAAANSASGYGAGGGGANNPSASAQAGGSGSNGCWIVDEYA